MGLQGFISHIESGKEDGEDEIIVQFKAGSEYFSPQQADEKLELDFSGKPMGLMPFNPFAGWYERNPNAWIAAVGGFFEEVVFRYTLQATVFYLMPSINPWIFWAVFGIFFGTFFHPRLFFGTSSQAVKMSLWSWKRLPLLVLGLSVGLFDSVLVMGVAHAAYNLFARWAGLALGMARSRTDDWEEKDEPEYDRRVFSIENVTVHNDVQINFIGVRRRMEEIASRQTGKNVEENRIGREEERYLFRALHANNINSQERLEIRNFLIMQYVWMYRRPAKIVGWRDLADAYQDASIALIPIIYKFEYRSDRRFSSDAAFYLLREMQAGAAKAKGVSLTYGMLSLLCRIRTETEKYKESNDGRAPSEDELAELCHMRPETVQSLLATVNPVSTDVGNSIGHYHHATMVNPDENLNTTKSLSGTGELRDYLYLAPPRLRLVLKLYHEVGVAPQMSGVKPTFEIIRKHLGITRARVGQLYKSGLKHVEDGLKFLKHDAIPPVDDNADMYLLFDLKFDTTRPSFEVFAQMSRERIRSFRDFKGAARNADILLIGLNTNKGLRSRVRFTVAEILANPEILDKTPEVLLQQRKNKIEAALKETRPVLNTVPSIYDELQVGMSWEELLALAIVRELTPPSKLLMQDMHRLGFRGLVLGRLKVNGFSFLVELARVDPELFFGKYIPVWWRDVRKKLTTHGLRENMSNRELRDHESRRREEITQALIELAAGVAKKSDISVGVLVEAFFNKKETDLGVRFSDSAIAARNMPASDWRAVFEDPAFLPQLKGARPQVDVEVNRLYQLLLAIYARSLNADENIALKKIQGTIIVPVRRELDIPAAIKFFKNVKDQRVIFLATNNIIEASLGSFVKGSNKNVLIHVVETSLFSGRTLQLAYLPKNLPRDVLDSFTDTTLMFLADEDIDFSDVNDNSPLNNILLVLFSGQAKSVVRASIRVLRAYEAVAKVLKSA